ncbi:protein AAR2 homolog isoform X2 [Nasonia vitripennis]|uniref:Protein AAR2 homolog n=1 Tax=Nasonia vitripennis TaxID=7425 RepID=A0A7M7G909_NASVI|nr:protein AAR2 homolog [Nasonia vitripennis]XP_001603971.1 protein AAR2 homolog isoform X2 [Nasonia vitripennis]
MSSDSIEMNQDLAKRLLLEGGTLVLLDVPTGTDFGIDIKSWNSGENFKGIKMIPPGFHFVHYSATDEYGESAPRVGFFRNFKCQDFIVKRWDKNLEDLSSEPVPEETVERLKANLKELDRYLGPYPFDMWNQWKDLTNKIDDSIVERCSPVCGFVRSALELVNFDDASRPRGTESRKRKRGAGLTVEEKEQELLPDLKPKPGTELRLSELPQKFYPDDATPAEITRHSLDTSYALDTLLNKLKDPMEIIGELQLSFVCFLAGQSLEAFEHWKGLVSLICKADSLIPSQRAVFSEFLNVLEIQLSHVPEEVLCDIVASNNFVYHNLRKLFANIESNTNVDDRLKSLAIRVRDRLTKKFLWDFKDLQEEDDDEAPVVVALD